LKDIMPGLKEIDPRHAPALTVRCGVMANVR